MRCFKQVVCRLHETLKIRQILSKVPLSSHQSQDMFPFSFHKIKTDFLAYESEIRRILMLLKCFNSSIQDFNTYVEAIPQVNRVLQEKYVFAQWFCCNLWSISLNITKLCRDTIMQSKQSFSKLCWSLDSFKVVTEI